MKKLLKNLGIAICCLAGMNWAVAQVLDVREVEKTLHSSCVDVVYELQCDEQGNIPAVLGLYCNSCSDFHDNNLAALLRNGMNLEVTGFLVAKDLVLVPDVMISASAVKSLKVSLDGKSVNAGIVKLYPAYGALLLKLDSPLPGGKVLDFKKAASGKLYCYSRIKEFGFWHNRLSGFVPPVGSHLAGTNQLRDKSPGNSLIINEKCEVVGVVCNNNEFDGCNKWDTPWTQWQGIDYAQYLEQRKQLQERLQQSVIPGTIHFKEEKLTRRERLEGKEGPTELDVYVIKLPGGKLFLPSLLLSPSTGALIDKVVLHLPDGDVEAHCKRMLNDFGGMEIEVPHAMDWLSVADKVVPMESETGNMVWSAELTSYGGKVDIKIVDDALGMVMRGYKNSIWGGVISAPGAGLIFSLNGELAGIRSSVRAFNYKDSLPFMSAAEIESLLNAPKAVFAVDNAGLQADAIAFMGVEYQSMNQALASSVKLQHLTQNGNEGLLITYVYPGSSADKLKLKAGDVLLKIIIPGGGLPMALKGREYAVEQEQQFPWAQLDKIPEEYFGDIPEPWKGIKDPLNDRLTTIGIGKKVQLIAICDGKLVRKEFNIEPAPEHFLVAREFTDKALGLEMRNITFEVRRYFRMDITTPGVMISNVFAGSPSSIAGLRPFEIITAVNDQAVYNVDDFKKAVQGRAEVVFSVRRLASNRVVKVTLPVGPRR